MVLLEFVGQCLVLFRFVQGCDDCVYWYELFGFLEVVYFFLVIVCCGCFMQVVCSLDVKLMLLCKILVWFEECFGLYLFVYEGNVFLLICEGCIVQVVGQCLVEDSQSYVDFYW